MTSPFILSPSRPAGLLAVLAAMALSACGSLQSSSNFLGVITPYRLEVVQGNVVTSEQAALVTPGMTPAQVREALGSPLLTDLFHSDRWDYVFTIRRSGAEPQLRRIVVRFKDQVLESIDTGGPLPSEREFVAAIDTAPTARSVPPLTLTPEQMAALPSPAPPKPPEPAPPAQGRSYPPLEPSS